MFVQAGANLYLAANWDSEIQFFLLFQRRLETMGSSKNNSRTIIIIMRGWDERETRYEVSKQSWWEEPAHWLTEDPIKWFNECSSESDAERKHKKDHEAFFNLIISLSYFSDKRFRISISPRSYFALWELSKVKQTESRAVEPQGDRRAHLQSKLSSRRHADTGWMLTEHIWLHLFRTEEQMEELLMSGDWGRWRGRRRRRSTLATRWSSRESSGWR